MSSIFGGLGTARDSLAAQQYALEITQKNIANVNTPGYSRQRVAFTPTDSTGPMADMLVTGAPKVSVESYRDRFIDYRINQEVQSQGEYDASSGALQPVQSLLNENTGQGLQTVLSQFFNSFSSLANSPEDVTLRQTVLSSGTQLTDEFHRLYERIQGVQTAQDRAVADTVNEINSITGQLAKLNAEIASAQAGNSVQESELRDQRQQMLEKLSGLIDVSYFETESGAYTITTRQGTALVLGDQSKALQAGVSSTGQFLRVQMDGQDVTSTIESGRLGGILKMRDVTLAGYLSNLDDLAASLIERINAQHALGSDVNGAQGGNFFVPFTPGAGGSNTGAARSMSVAISDPEEIAAASLGGGPGSNANARNLSAIRDEQLPGIGNLSAGQYYSQLVYTVGRDAQTADEGLKTQTQLLAQLQNQRDSTSGVSLDEEAVNIIRYQKAYEASARLVQVWDTLADAAIKLLGS